MAPSANRRARFCHATSVRYSAPPVCPSRRAHRCRRGSCGTIQVCSSLARAHSELGAHARRCRDASALQVLLSSKRRLLVPRSANRCRF